MKRKILISITIIAILLLIFIYINQNLFSTGVKYVKYRYLSNEREVTDFKEIQENPFNKYVDEEMDVNKDPTISEVEYEEIGPNNNNNSESTSNPGSPTNSTNSVVKGKPTLSQISRKYMKEFEAMESQFRANLESLVDSGIKDYSTGEYGKFDLADIYLQKGEKMEAESDKEFYQLLSNLENKLVENSYSPEMVKDVENYYIKLKDYEKNRTIDKGLALLEK